MTDRDALLRDARSAFERESWTPAYERFTAADEAGALGVDDLERFAVAAYLTGRDDEGEEAWSRAHAESVRSNDVRRAARSAFWVALDLLNRGEWARANGWVVGARRLLEEADARCAEYGLLLALAARTHLKHGEMDAANEAVSRAIELSERFDDAELEVFCRLAYAQVRAQRGDTAAAVTLFDEIMVAVTTRDVSPVAVGVAYCAVIDGCQSFFDLGRAREWTAALSRWCDAQPDLVPFRGKCLVHRSEILRLSGAWSRALEAAEHACEFLLESIRDEAATDVEFGLSPFKYPIGPAHYELAEIHRLRGQLDDADAAYRQASQHGSSPQPGLALLRAAQGRLDEAAAAVRRLLGERQSRPVRVGVLAASVEVLLAARDVDRAREAADELARLAAGSDAIYLRAVSGLASGSVLLAEGKARQAVAALREAWMAWQEIEAPYEAARVRVLLGLGCRALGDTAAAELELEAANRVFERLSAAPDIARVGRLRRERGSEPQPDDGLTPREREVIALIATGRTNQAIAKELHISKRTVDRHVSNILMKLGLPTRSAATAYAYEHGLV